jgi:tRNA (guanine-N7-)-methyltransferase
MTMGKKKKLARFAENATFTNLFQVSWNELNAQPFAIRGRWHEEFFLNSNPIVLELGCGKGEYTVGLARKNPEMNFIGVDIKGARLWKGCKAAQEENLNNVGFIRTRIQNIDQLFAPGEVREIWITFPDPQPGIARERKRLTSPGFINRYRKIMDDRGLIHLKTDDSNLFEYSRNTFASEKLHEIAAYDDLDQSGFDGDATAITTYYEQIWRMKGLKIKYLCGKLTPTNAHQ